LPVANVRSLITNPQKDFMKHTTEIETEISPDASNASDGSTEINPNTNSKKGLSPNPEDPCCLELDPDFDTDFDESLPGPASRDGFPFVFVGVVVGLFVLVQPGSLSWIGKAITSNAAFKRSNLGTVQKITYVGGFAYATQVETDTQTLLLSGSVALQKGDHLERRDGPWSTEVCHRLSQQCWDLRSH
jgi:hypothetical protein